ncbi:MAG: DUF3825 domain-containing protein [Clostridia bacterium]|nr:DUF3825 domain-containing protein [Clostridia bacterium]
MFCTNCGNQLNNDVRFCCACGAPVMSQPTVELEETEPTAAAEPVAEAVDGGALYSFSDDLRELADLSGSTLASLGARVAMPTATIAIQLCGEFRAAYAAGTITRVGDDLSFASKLAVILLNRSTEDAAYPYTLRFVPLDVPRADAEDLTEEILGEIRALFAARYAVGEWFPMASAGHLLKDNGYNWERFGFSKMKLMLPSLSTLFDVQQVDATNLRMRLKPEGTAADETPSGDMGYAFSGVLSELIDPQSAPVLALARQLEETPEKTFETLADTFAIAYVHGMIGEDGTALHFDTATAEITLQVNQNAESPYPYYLKFHIEAEDSGEVEPLTLAIEKEIYSLLTRKFAVGEWLPMASVNLELHRCGYNKERFGFAKMKAMLETLRRFLVVDDTQKTNGVPNDRVKLHRVTEWEQELPPASTEKKAAVRLPETLDGVSLSAKTLSKIYQQMTGSEVTPPQPVIDALYEAYAAAEKPDTTFEVDEIFVFKTELKSGRGKAISVSIKVSDREDTDWYLNWGGVTDSTSTAKPGDALTQFAFLGPWQEFLRTLASKALDEQWSFKDASADDYTILKQYIKFTFYHLQLEDKILISDDGSLAAFNTGLVDRHYEDIFACFSLNTTPGYQKWYFKGFCIAGERGLGKVLVDCFDPLPQPASYFSVKEDLLFDLDREIYSDYHHMIVDNIDRLPLEFLHEETRGNAEAQALVEQITAAEAADRPTLYNALRDAVENSSRLYNRLRNRMEDAIDLAVKRVRWNFKTALPCFYPQGNAMSLMLPLALVQDERADVALVVERTKSGSYQGQTILSLQAADIDARLICRPDSDWLRTSEIVATESVEYEE